MGGRLVRFNTEVMLLPSMLNMVGVNGASANMCVVHGISEVLTGGDGGPPAGPVMSFDWLSGFTDPAARSMMATPGSTIELKWTGMHNVYSMASKEKFEACDFSDAVLLGDTSPVY